MKRWTMMLALTVYVVGAVPVQAEDMLARLEPDRVELRYPDVAYMTVSHPLSDRAVAGCGGQVGEWLPQVGRLPPWRTDRWEKPRTTSEPSAVSLSTDCPARN